MGEIKTNDLQEVKRPIAENYQTVKPEEGMTVHEARKTWDSVFDNEYDDGRSKSLEEGKTDKIDDSHQEDSPREDNKQRNDNGETQEAKNDLIDQAETGMTMEEIALLDKMMSGKIDGLVGNVLYTTGGSSVWTEIKDGNPVRYKQGPGGKYFDGKENVRFEGVKHIQEKWETNEEKLVFLQKYGWLIEDDDVKRYSEKFKPEK